LCCVSPLPGAQADFVDAAVRSLLREVRPDAAGLVDALVLSDYELDSCLGRSDGNVYQALFDAANHPANPMNKLPEGPAWEPVLKKLFARSKM